MRNSKMLDDKIKQIFEEESLLDFELYQCASAIYRWAETDSLTGNCIDYSVK